jgi:hypothetical protein
VHADCIQALERSLADAGNRGNGQGIEDCVHLARANDDEAVRLVEIRCDLCDQFICGDADRCREAGALANPVLDRQAYAAPGAEKAPARGHVEERLVQ